MKSARLLIQFCIVYVLLAGCYYNPSPGDYQSNCPTDDPRVGWVAELHGLMHAVSGTARIMDNCTIVIEHFTYDGLAADGRIVGYKAENPDWTNPVILTAPLRAYSDETLTVPLPVGVTLNDVERISVTCVVGADFLEVGNLGDGVFHAP